MGAGVWGEGQVVGEVYGAVLLNVYVNHIFLQVKAIVLGQAHRRQKHECHDGENNHRLHPHYSLVEHPCSLPKDLRQSGSSLWSS